MHGDQGLQGFPSSVRGGKLIFLPAPVRLLDTRTVGGGRNFPACNTPDAQLTGGVIYSFPARSLCMGIPSEGIGIIGNATVINYASNSYMTFWPEGLSRPGTSNINYRTVLGVTNVAFFSGIGVVRGGISIFSGATTDLILDVVGYFAK